MFLSMKNQLIYNMEASRIVFFPYYLGGLLLKLGQQKKMFKDGKGTGLGMVCVGRY